VRPIAGDIRGLGVKSFALALIFGARTYSTGACLRLNLGLILFSLVVVYTAQIIIVPGIAAFARKIAAENREKTK
jgi:hypothetical protein